MPIYRATLTAFTLATYVAQLRVDGSTPQRLENVPVALHIPPGQLTAGRKVLLDTGDHGDPADAVVFAALPAGAAISGDPWPAYVLDTDANWVDLTDGGATTLHSHAGGAGPSTLKTTAAQIINGTAFQDITGLTFSVLANTDYAFRFYIAFRSTATTGFRFGVNGPAGVVDYVLRYQTVANSATAGVATFLDMHNVGYDQMTVLTATITTDVDLYATIEGRVKVSGAGGTFAARVASELANNDLVIQKGSWGMYF